MYSGKYESNDPVEQFGLYQTEQDKSISSIGFLRKAQDIDKI